MDTIHAASSLIDKLRSVLVKQRITLFLAGVAATILAATLAWLSLSAVANIVLLPVWVKLTLIAVSVGITAYVFGRYALVRLYQGSIDQVALALEERHPEMQGRLIAAIQFARSETYPGYSRELVALTEQQAVGQADQLDLSEVVSFRPAVRIGRWLAGAVGLGLALLVLFPGFFGYSYEVYSNATTEVGPPLSYQIVPVPGSREWTKYQDITIGAALFGQRLPGKASVHYRLAGGSWQRNDIDVSSLPRAVSGRGDSLAFGVTLRQVNKSLDYYVEAGRVKTDQQRIDVVDRPRVNSLKLSIFYPSYTGLAPQVIDENNGSFSAVVGSRVTVQVEANQPVANAELVFNDSSHVPLSLKGRTGEASLVVDSSITYHVLLRDKLGNSNPDPIEYSVTAVPDEYPTVEVLRPGFDANLSDEMILPLLVRISDDYGFSSLVMKYAVTTQAGRSGENVAVLNFSNKIKTEGQIEFNWSMDQLNLFPGDYVTYYFEVADNDRISGPKIGRSRQFIARLPSLEEIVSQTETENQERISGTEKMIQTGKELAERVKNAARKLESQNKTSASPKGDWQQQKELEAITQQQEQMLQDLKNMAQRMDSSLDKMKDNALMGREIMDKLQQIQKLFEEVATPEMKEAQKKLMDALKKMDRNSLEQALKDFQMSQKELLNRLERTLALLKRMQVEQKMEAMMRQAEDLVKRQEQNNRSTDSLGANQLPKLSSVEDKIKNDLEELRKKTGELREQMKQAELQSQPEAQKFAEAIEKTSAGEDMKQMSQSLQQQQQSSASQSGKQALAKLNEMLGQMQAQQMAMKGGDSEAIKRAMQRAIEDANTLSQNQEELLKQASELSPMSFVIHDMAASQQDLAASCSGLKNSISELGKQSPFVAAELERIVDNALRNMNMATQGFEDRQAANATAGQREAMSDLNQASIRMMESLENQSQCNKGGSCSKPMAQLESLTNKQNQLNQKTQQCNNPGGEKPSEDGRETLQRLAGEQATIRKSLQHLDQEFGDSRQVLGRLSDISKEMKEIEEDLSEGEIGPATTDRQLRVYSRMLEASRSLQRKDYSEQRKATTASSSPVYLPPSLTSDLLNDRAAFEDRLKQFLGDRYPAQYQEQIKAYFRALLQLESAPPESQQPATTQP